jgi:hypothetical protein
MERPGTQNLQRLLKVFLVGAAPPLPPRKTKRRADGSRLRETLTYEDPCTGEGTLAKGIIKEMLRHKSLLNVSDYILSTVSIPSNESPC